MLLCVANGKPNTRLEFEPKSNHFEVKH